MDHSAKSLELDILAEVFRDLTVDYVTIRITETMLIKSIMDANMSVQSFFRRHSILEYTEIAQGEKILADAIFIHDSKSNAIRVSYYRPLTKSGDPRFWIYGLRTLAQDGDLLLAVWVAGQLIYFVLPSELSKATTLRLAIIALGATFDSSVAKVERLRQKLVKVNELGWVQSKRSGDTGVGFTLETLLGIKANSSREPDFDGIELKCKRVKHSKRSTLSSQPMTLFSQVPVWNETITGTKTLVQKYGYLSDGRRNLVTSVQARPNNRGWKLSVEHSAQLVHTMQHSDHVFHHSIALLDASLKQKHSLLAFVEAEAKVENGTEFFRYRTASLYSGASIQTFIQLIELNVIRLDILAHLKQNGSAKDHGYLWRIPMNGLPVLFSVARVLDLAEL